MDIVERINEILLIIIKVFILKIVKIMFFNIGFKIKDIELIILFIELIFINCFLVIIFGFMVFNFILKYVVNMVIRKVVV